MVQGQVQAVAAFALTKKFSQGLPSHFLEENLVGFKGDETVMYRSFYSTGFSLALPLESPPD